MANGYVTINCSSTTDHQTVATGSCTNEAANAGNGYTTIICPQIAGQKIQMTTTTSVFTQYLSGGIISSTLPTTSSATALADVDGICYTPGVSVLPLLPTAQPALPTGCTAWPCSVDTPNAIGGSFNSLADVAQYYYVNDLRPDMADLTAVATGSALSDRAPWQHMSTYVLGLGVSGTLAFKPDYMTSSTGDFSLIRPPAVVPPAVPLSPTLKWPAWPDLAIDYASDLRLYSDPKSIDDFWHAAVNGRGQYFSAGDPAAVVDGLSAALTKIASEAGAGGGAAVSNSAPVASDNFSFLTSFTTNEWSGDVSAQKINVATGIISSNVEWSAQAKLDAVTSKACDNRKIYIRRAGGANNLVNFTWDTKACDAGLPTGQAETGLNSTEKALFGSSAVASLGQYPSMTDGSNSSVNQRSAAAGSNLVNFVRGQRGLEVTTEAFTPNNANTLYRKRAHVLGDIVGSVVAFVKEPSANYVDSGYDSFKSTNAARTPMIYVGANDGMLHAIYAPISSSDANFANAGAEAWAYIPQVVMPELYRLADTEYKANHQFFVDGTPTYGDVYDSASSTWKTILVGGLNAGGKGYYALDITNPTTPKSLWEFNFSSVCYDGTTGTADADCHIGLSFGRPIITKLTDGTWVVLVTSGYNNVRASAGTGDGQGYLYVLNAATGKIISKISTGAGTASNPSGLREVNNYVANGALDNTALRAYGGDLLGNVWRFDINNNIAPAGKEATLVAVAKDSSGTVQPITTRLQLAEVDGSTMIVAATGKFLGSSDASTTQVQSVYGFKDTPGESVVYLNLRDSLRTVSLTPTRSGTSRTAACTGNSTNCGLSSGWVVDLPESKERVNVNPFIVLGTLVFVSNVPSNSACQAGGHSWINYLNLLSGTTVASSADGVASDYLNDSLSVGLGFVLLPDGRVIGTSVGSDTSRTTKEIPVEPPSPIGRRVSWREIKR